MDISRKSLSVGIFTWLLQYFPKNMAILVRKLGEEEKVVKIRFRLFKDLNSSSSTVEVRTTLAGGDSITPLGARGGCRGRKLQFLASTTSNVEMQWGMHEATGV